MGQIGLRDRATCERDCIVTLYGSEWTTAHSIALQRHTNNWKKSDSRNYTDGREAGRIAPEQQAAPRTIIGELAVAKWTNQFWSPHAWQAADHRKYEHLPDVGSNIEVRTVMSETNAAKIHKSQVGKSLMLWVAYTIPDEFYQVRMLGWLPYDLAWSTGTSVVYGTSNEPSATDRQIARKHLYHPLHTAESVANTTNPRKPPPHTAGCRCRLCLGLLKQVHVPDF